MDSTKPRYPHETTRDMQVQHAQETIASLQVQLYSDLAEIVAKEPENPTVALAQVLLSKSTHENAKALHKFISQQQGNSNNS